MSEAGIRLLAGENGIPLIQSTDVAVVGGSIRGGNFNAHLPTLAGANDVQEDVFP